VKNRVEVEILGNRYNLKTESAPDHVHKIANYLNRQIEGVSKGVSTVSAIDLSILAALNITDELFKLREDIDSKYRSLYGRTSELVQHIERHID